MRRERRIGKPWSGMELFPCRYTLLLCFSQLYRASLDKSAALSNDGTGGTRPSRALNQAHGSGIHKAG